jgi:prepilin-type N-terminal cleavage/methylation domain-containing protein
MKKGNGFSLLELLVAMAVFSVLLVLTLNVIERAGSLSAGSMAKMESTRVARECLDLIHRDLSSVMLPYNRTSTKSLQLLVSPSKLDAAYANPHSLFWQAPLSRDFNKGTLPLVGYFVQRSMGATPEDNRFQLRRLFVEESNREDYSLLSTKADWYRELAPDFAASGGAAVSEDSDATSGYKGWVADGVLGLWIRCLESPETPITKNAAGENTGFSFDSRQAYQSSTGNYSINFSALPPFIEIGLVTCSPSDVRRINTIPSLAPGDEPADFHKNISDFVTEIQNKNPRAKTISAYTRIIPILTAAP